MYYILIFMKHLCYAITWKGCKDKHVKCSHHPHGETPTGKARFSSSLKIKQCRDRERDAALQDQKENDPPSRYNHKAGS